MKAFGINALAILSLLLGSAAFAGAQQEQRNEKQDKPEQQQSRQQPQRAQQEQRQDQSRQPQRAQQQPQQDQNKQAQRTQQQSNQSRQQPQRAQQQQDRNNQSQRAQQQQPQQNQNQRQQNARQQRGNQQPQRTQEQQHVQQAAWQEHRARSWQSDHRTWQQRGGYNGYRIPDDRFRGYFGPQHGFRIYGLPFLVVGGYPRFQYDGYWLSMVDPWPESWANNWYDTDDVYISYVNNGYYLFDRRHPSIGIAISISM